MHISTIDPIARDRSSVARSHRRRSVWLGRLAIAAIAALVPTLAEASCKEGFCVSGRDVGNKHIVDFSTTYTNVTHFNFNDGHDQIELGGHESEVTWTDPAPGSVLHYGFQACSGGGTFQRSSCSPWVWFTHTVK